MAGTKVEPSQTTHGEITLDLSAAAGPAVEERQEDDQEDVGQEDGQEKKGGVGGGGRLGGWGRGETRGSDVPSRRISPLTCCHTNRGTICVGLKDRGRGRGLFFLNKRL